MRYAQAQVEDSRLETERRLRFKGSARISLDVLHFQPRKHRVLNVKRIEFLKGCFRNDRCRRLEVRNHIEAEVDIQILDTALRRSGVTAQELLSIQSDKCPELVFPEGFQLECLHGQHRIQAAREFLLPHDKWWTVDLYASDLNSNLKTCLQEQYANERWPTDGEAYQKIRGNHFQQNTSGEMQWKSRLQGSRLRNLKGLLADEELTNGFDALLGIPGLWGGMRITTLHKVVAMRSKDMILNYLGHIRTVWSGLVGGDPYSMERIDQATVEAVELKAPRASTRDSDDLKRQLQSGEIFSAFSDHERDEIWARLQMVDGLIPSLFTFFKDIQYLQLCMDCVKRLTRLSSGQSISDALGRKFARLNQEEGQVKIQVAGDTFIHQPGSHADQVDLGCRQLYAFAMREYPSMPADPVREDLVKKAATKADQAVLRRLADLAHQIGFDSPQIHNLRQYPNTGTVRQAHPQLPPLEVTSGPGPEKSDRCGKPHDWEYQENREFLYINHLHDEQRYRGEGITSFFVRKSVYLAFFGKPDRSCSAAGRTVYSPPESPRLGSTPSIRTDCIGSQRHPASQSQETSEHTDDDIESIMSCYNYEDMSRFQGTSTEADGNGGEAGEEDNGQSPNAAENMAVLDIILYHSDSQERERMEEKELERKRRQRKIQDRERLVRAKQDRLEQIRLEKIRLEQEKAEQYRLERTQQQEKAEQDRLEQTKQQEKAEQDRLDQIRLEQEKADQDQLEHDRLEQVQQQEKAEQDRLEHDRLEEEKANQDRLEHDRLEHDRLEHDRLEQIRLEQEKADQDQLEHDRLEQIQQQEKAEQDRLEQTKQQEKAEQDRLEHDRLEEEKANQDRLEQVQLEQIQQQEKADQDQLENDRLQHDIKQIRLEHNRQMQMRLERDLKEIQLEQEKADQDRLEHDRLEKIQLEQIRLDQIRLDQIREKADQTRLEQDKVEHGQLEQIRDRLEQVRQEHDRLEQEKVQINFLYWKMGVWKDDILLAVHPRDPSEVERVAKRYLRDKVRTFSTTLNMLAPDECFQTAIDDRTHTILLVSQRELSIDDKMLESAYKVHDQAVKNVLKLKRIASTDISEMHHSRKRRNNRDIFIAAKQEVSIIAPVIEVPYNSNVTSGNERENTATREEIDFPCEGDSSEEEL